MAQYGISGEKSDFLHSAVPSHASIQTIGLQKAGWISHALWVVANILRLPA